MKQNMNDFEKRLREAETQQLEAYALGLDEAPVMYKQQSGGLLKAEAGEPMVFVASEESEDRMGDIIEVNGWKLDDYKKNPVFMFIHQHSVAPLGTVPKVWVEGKQLLNTVDWDEADPLASFVKGKYERNVMRAVSVGFRPIEFEMVDDKKGMFGAYRFKASELLEISAVPIPAHPKALQKAALTKQFYMSVPDLSLIKEDEDSVLDTEQSEVYQDLILGHEDKVTKPLVEPDVEPDVEADETSETPPDDIDVEEETVDELLVETDELTPHLDDFSDEKAVSKANRNRITRAMGLLRAVLNDSGEEEPESSQNDDSKAESDEEAEKIVVEENMAEVDWERLLQGIRDIKNKDESLTEVEG
jgi:hypothetical protein